MTLADRRELQPLTELEEGESKPTYQDNVEFTVGAEGKDYEGETLTNCISVKMQVRDMNVDLAEITPLRVYLCASSTGAGAATALSEGGDSVTVRTGTQIAVHTAKADLLCLTDTNGILTIDIVNTQAETPWYVVAVYGSRIFVSSVLTWV